MGKWMMGLVLAMLLLGIAPKAMGQQKIAVYDYEGLEPMLHRQEPGRYIVNFWAMWCAPCVAELPHLEAYAKAHPEVKLLLVSMDFVQDIDTKLKPFLAKRGISSEVVLLDDADANSWIDKIYPKWSGALPFTIIYDTNKRGYYERTFDSIADIEAAVQQTLDK